MKYRPLFAADDDNDKHFKFRCLLNEIVKVYPSLESKLFDRFSYVNEIIPKEPLDESIVEVFYIEYEELILQTYFITIKRGYYLPVSNIYIPSCKISSRYCNDTNRYVETIGEDLLYVLRDNPEHTKIEEVEKRREVALKISKAGNTRIMSKMVEKVMSAEDIPNGILENEDVSDEDVLKTMPEFKESWEYRNED